MFAFGLYDTRKQTLFWSRFQRHQTAVYRSRRRQAPLCLRNALAAESISGKAGAEHAR